MLDPALLGDVAMGVVTGVAGNAAYSKLTESIAHPDPQLAALILAVKHLENIHKAVSRNSHEDLIFQLGSASTSEVVVPDKGRPHLSILIPSQTTTSGNITSAQLVFAIPGVGQLTSNLSPGWTQLDLPAWTRIWTADSNSYNVILSFRDDPLGSFL